MVSNCRGLHLVDNPGIGQLTTPQHPLGFTPDMDAMENATHNDDHGDTDLLATHITRMPMRRQACWVGAAGRVDQPADLVSVRARRGRSRCPPS